MPVTSRSRALTTFVAGALALASLATVPSAYAVACGTAPTITVDETAPVVPGETFHVSGTGFCPGQRMAVKIDRDAYGQVGADEGESRDHATRGRIEAGPDGTFTAEPVALPRWAVDGKATEAGRHTVHLLDNDPVVNPTAVFEAAVSYTAVVDTSSAGEPGGHVTVSGTGWLDRAGTASSTVGVVLEQAGTDSIVATEHVAGHTPHTNTRVWAVVPASAFTATGSFSHRVALPDGTTAGPLGSTVAFGGRSYRVRLWSGAQLGNGADITRNRVVEGDFAVAAPPVVQPVPDPKPVPPSKLRNTRKPVVKGKARVGRTLRATRGAWNTAGVKVTYRWLRNGKVIKGATRAEHRLVKKDAGKKVRVVVRATKKGWTGATVRSKVVRVRR